MSRNLAKLLGKPQKELADLIAKLEDICGYPSEDVRLFSDNLQRLRQRLHQLGLDPNDTTGEELFHALIARYAHDSREIDRVLGVNSNTGVSERIGLVINITKHFLPKDEIWALKNPAAKKILRQYPPKRYMRLKNFRSLESMLKRVPVTEILLVAPQVESLQWAKAISKAAASIGPSNYEPRSFQIVKINPKRISEIDVPRNYIASSPWAGAAAIWPSSDINGIPTATLTLLLLEEIGRLNVAVRVQNFYSVHPVLQNWAQSEDVLAPVADGIVSLNIKDAATNHLRQADYSNRTNNHAKKALWQSLIERYRLYSEAVDDELQKLEQKAKGTTKNLPAEPSINQLAEEYSLVEQ